jgi:hypothetical protein
MRRRHDPFLKRLYRAGTRDALTLFLPHLAARIDWSQWEWLDKEVPILGRRRRSVVADLVGLTRDVEGRYLKVLVHPELQMRADTEMNWRALQYNAGLLLREGNADARVLTVVFYHCPGVGGIRKHRVDLDFYEEPSLLGLTYWSVGLGDLEAEPYAEQENPMGWALASWMRQPRETRVELRLRLMEKILRFVRAEEYQELLLDTVQSYYRLSRAERQTEQRLARSGKFGEVEEMAQTVLDRMKAKERREGRQEGEVLAAQRAVQQAIRVRFPQAPPSLVDQVEQIGTVTALESLHARVIVAASVEEVERLLRAGA